MTESKLLRLTPVGSPSSLTDAGLITVAEHVFFLGIAVLWHNEVVEIRSCLIRHELHHRAPGAGPASGASVGGGDAFVVVVDEQDEPLNIGEHGKPGEGTRRGERPSRPQGGVFV